jgi:hypothetical protein
LRSRRSGILSAPDESQLAPFFKKKLGQLSDSKLIFSSPKRHPGAHHPSFERDKIAMEKSKLDILDLEINVLKEHEKNLDKLLERLETLIEAIFQIQTRLEVLCEDIEKTL